MNLISMEIDVLSPLSPMHKTTTLSKRGRSPDDAEQTERPLKRRPAVTTGRVEPISISGPSYPSYSTRSTRNSPQSSRHASEDWVQQTVGLSIDSPLTMSTNSSDTPGGDMEQDLMQTDSDDLADGTFERPKLPPLQISNSSRPDLTLSKARMHSMSPAIAATHRLPSINILPPTPEIEFTSPAQESAPQSDIAMNMSSSPITSSPSLTPNLKRRLTMGPRMDCEKCRHGVKGHWIHFD